MKMRSIRALRITTLAENSAWIDERGLGYLGQWGLSFLLEIVDGKGETRKVVFDTGLDKKALFHNIKVLKANLSDVDCVVLSHGHLDHTAATVEIVKAAKGVKIYGHPHTFLPRFFVDKKGKRHQLGIPKGERLEDIEKAGGDVVLTTEPIEVVPGVWTTGRIQRVTRFEQPLPLSEGEKLIIAIDGNEVDDQILDDQALWMHVDRVGSYVVTGCAHSGLVNTLSHVQKLSSYKRIHGMVGGTHLIDRSAEYLQKTIAELRRFQLSLISPCHDTGFKAAARLWQAFPDAFVWNFSGRVIDSQEQLEMRVV